MTDTTLRPIDGNGHTPELDRSETFTESELKDAMRGLAAMLEADATGTARWMRTGIESGDRAVFVAGLLAAADYGDIPDEQVYAGLIRQYDAACKLADLEYAAAGVTP